MLGESYAVGTQELRDARIHILSREGVTLGVATQRMMEQVAERLGIYLPDVPSDSAMWYHLEGLAEAFIMGR